jgi:hypothetical protein
MHLHLRSLLRFRRKNVKQLSPVPLRDDKLERCLLISWCPRSQGNCITSRHFISLPVPAEGFEPLTLGLGVVCLTTVLPPHTRGVYHKTFYSRNLQIFVIN